MKQAENKKDGICCEFHLSKGPIKTSLIFIFPADYPQTSDHDSMSLYVSLLESFYGAELSVIGNKMFDFEKFTISEKQVCFTR